MFRTKQYHIFVSPPQGDYGLDRYFCTVTLDVTNIMPYSEEAANIARLKAVAECGLSESAAVNVHPDP